MQTLRSTFVSLVTVLLGIGVLMVFSSSMTARPSDFEQVYLSRHLLYLAIAVALAFVVSSIPAEWLLRLAPTFFAGSILLLLAVLIPGLGVRVNGSQRWLRLGLMSFQPSELAKVTLPLFLCWLLEQRRAGGVLRGAAAAAGNLGDLRPWLHRTGEILAPIGLAALLVLVEPDLGTAAFLTLIGGMTLFLSGWPIRDFALGLGAVVPLAAGVIALKPYQLKRIEGFVQAWTDFQNAPYQVKQSLTTLGAGGTVGVGLGKGWQKLSFLPEANTDFVFAVVGEELGLAGTLSVLAIWSALLVTGLLLLRGVATDRPRHVVGTVLLTQLVLQALVNIAVVTAMLPPKGIAHPLLSAGGSSLLGSLLAIGVFLSMTKSQEAAAATLGAPLTDAARQAA